MGDFPLLHVQRTCACRASWRSSQVEVHCRHQCHVAPVCQWCDDQARAVAQVLIAIGNRGLQ
jgi:hypothetical protein